MPAINQTNSTINPGVKSNIATDFEILQKIINEKKEINWIKVSWIKAYQDEGKSGKGITLEAKLNILADTDVNIFHANTPDHLEPSSTPTVLPSAKSCIPINSCVITRKIQQCLHGNYTSVDIFDHIWKKKTDLTKPDMNLNDRGNLGSALECQ
eukprot:14365962-Ditylum_brightwellii.AAC.1